jgi:XTP/dITP diphosphohydrolase
MRKKIVLATGNSGKVSEFNQMLTGVDIEIIPQTKLGVSEADETASTFVENSLIKARHACIQTGLPAIADDSGLVIPALGGQPGIYSARFAGDKGNNQKNIAKVLELMADTPDTQRQAYFCAVVVYLENADDAVPQICQGICHGKILRQAQGTGGFGYDPIFYIDKYNCSAAQLDTQVKNTISHRGIATNKLCEYFKSIEL